MPVRGIRGAVTVDQDIPDVIINATRTLLKAIMVANPDLRVNDIASVWFTLTDDLRSEFPAKAARQLGWTETPLMCAAEIPVPGSLPRCIRVLIHWNTDQQQPQIQHIYLGEAIQLRPDLACCETKENQK